MIFPAPLLSQAETLLDRYRAEKLRIVTAESCTGGMLAALLTEISGASDVVERGFITYSNQAKTELLGVPETLLARYGAVSKECAIAMANGALAASRAERSIAITGIAGPNGGTAEKPVGLVHIACASKKGVTLHEAPVFTGDRGDIRLQAVEMALKLLQF